jgi:hypothetical protein
MCIEKSIKCTFAGLCSRDKKMSYPQEFAEAKINAVLANLFSAEQLLFLSG